ncbi:hypothetical protein Pmani_019743 [Petrolisthes manimaculis]|uniref:Protein regulator of cytokinesis 1 n=1 Tax=Petrolisthes manimaculis TaxID=1843537 RepID=A0AAE1PHX5_9EUCA|nr:hypothetical protein Pmani_019743 [Petrolisthes manimaculis]
MAEKSELRLSTQGEMNKTLDRLSEVWDDIGLTPDDRENRKKHFFGHIANLCDQILEDEMALKARIISKIERNTRDILKLCEELCTEAADESVAGLTLLELDEVLQDRLDKLKHTRDQRLEKLRQLHEKDKELCEILGETPYYIPSDLVPAQEDLGVFEDHITVMEKEKAEREVTYHKLKTDVLEFLRTLEHSPEDSFTQDLICATNHEDILLTKSYLHQLRNVHSDLEFRVRENEARSLILREEVGGLWTLLSIPPTHQQAFLATAPNHTPSHIAKLEEELERLRVLRSQNLEKFMVNVRTETEEWWEKCFVDPAVRERLQDLYAGEATEDSLAAYEAEIRKWKHYHTQNTEIFGAFARFLSLYKNMEKLEQRAKDPSRLFNTRGGALLQEEKAKRKVKNELPKVEERLKGLAGEWADREGRAFEVYGLPVMQYIDELWNSHDKHREEEKNKRQQAKGSGGGSGLTSTPHPRTPVPAPGSTRKRGREGDENTNTKKAKQGGTAFLKSPSKSVLHRSPVKTPKGKPLREYNPQYLQFHPPSSSLDSSLQSTISYDKFEASIGARRCDEIIHSSFLEGKGYSEVMKQQPALTVDHTRERRLRDTLHLASPCKSIGASHKLRNPFSAAASSQSPSKVKTKSTLRRGASQPNLFTGQQYASVGQQTTASPRYYGNPRFYRHKDHPLRFLI